METRSKTPKGFTLIEAMVSLVVVLALTVSFATIFSIIPRSGTQDEMVIEFRGEAYPPAPSFGQLRAATEFFDRFNDLLANRHAVYVLNYAVSTSWRPISSTSGLQGIPFGRHLSPGPILQNPANNFSSAIIDMSAEGMLPSSFFIMFLGEADNHYSGFVHCNVYEDQGRIFYEVIMRNGDGAKVAGYRYYIPDQAQFSFDYGVTYHTGISAADQFREHAGAVTVIFPDPFLLAGDNFAHGTKPVSRFTYFLQQN